MRRCLGNRRHRRGISSVEFALVAPIMGIIVLGLTDLADAIITLHRLSTVAQQVGLMATQMSVQPNQTTTLTVAQLDEASSVIFSVLPGLAQVPVYNPTTNPIPPYAVVVSDIVFTPTTGGCTAGLDCTAYTANLAWSVPLQYGQQINRPCGIITQNAAGTPPAIVNNLPSTLPTANVTSARSSVLTVDIVYNFSPIFFKFLGNVTMRQTAYFNERSFVASYITYNTAGEASGGVVCTAQGYV